MNRARLPKTLKADIEAVLEAACARPPLFVIGLPPPAKLPDVPAALDELDPTQISSIATELRRLVDSALLDSPRWLSSAERAERLVARAVAVSPDAPILLSVAWSGYLREAAVKRFPAGCGSFRLALLLLRTNDWVSQVRSAAAGKIDAFLEDASVEHPQKVQAIVGCAGLILDQERFGRLDAASQATLARLARFPGVGAALHEVVQMGRADNAPRILRLGLRGQSFDDALPDLALHGRHHRVRQMALQALLCGRFTWKQNRRMVHRDLDDCHDRDRLAAAGLQDRSVEVQRVALRHVVQDKGSALHNERVFRSFLSHRSMSMVERAAFALRTLGVDIVSESRGQLRSEQPSVASVRVLARYGDASDGDLIYAARDRCITSDTSEFLVAAARLSCAPAVEELRRIALEADDLEAARQASRALMQAGADFGFEALEAALVHGTGFLERGLVAFAVKLSVVRMTHLTVLLMRKDIGADCEELWRIIAHRRNRGLFQPSEAEISALSTAVGADVGIAEKVHELLGLRLARPNVFRLG